MIFLILLGVYSVSLYSTNITDLNNVVNATNNYTEIAKTTAKIGFGFGVGYGAWKVFTGLVKAQGGLMLGFSRV